MYNIHQSDEKEQVNSKPTSQRAADGVIAAGTGIVEWAFEGEPNRYDIYIISVSKPE